MHRHLWSSPAQKARPAPHALASALALQRRLPRPQRRHARPHRPHHKSKGFLLGSRICLGLVTRRCPWQRQSLYPRQRCRAVKNPAVMDAMAIPAAAVVAETVTAKVPAMATGMQAEKAIVM